LRHGNEDAGVVQVLFVRWPVDAFLVALLRTGAFLKGQARQEEQEGCQEDEADTAGIEGGVRAAVGGKAAVAGGGDGDDVDCWVKY